MRILQIAPLWERVPPPAYGGIEYVVSVLTDELARMGHEVTLVASGDSVTSGRLLAVYGRSLRTAENIKEPAPYTWVHVAQALAEARSFDIVHNHAGELTMAMQRLSSTPMLTTLHNLVTPAAKAVWGIYTGYYNTPSRAATYGLSHLNFAGVIYHGVDVATFPFSPDKEEYLLFLSRMSPEKGPLEAIEVAKRLGRKLIMAGKVDAVDHDFFWSEVAPQIDGRLIEYRGEADYHQKRELYAGASCLLFPIKWNEPFGLVMAEAMACGTPVVAFRSGAAPEVVADGLTGYVVDDIDSMVEAVKKIERIDHWRVREHVERHFSAEAMTKAYLRTYARVIERHKDTRRAKRRFVAPPGTLVR